MTTSTKEAEKRGWDKMRAIIDVHDSTRWDEEFIDAAQSETYLGQIERAIAAHISDQADEIERLRSALSELVALIDLRDPWDESAVSRWNAAADNARSALNPPPPSSRETEIG